MPGKAPFNFSRGESRGERGGAGPVASSPQPFSFRRRLNLVAVLALIPALPIMGRLAYLHVYQGNTLSSMAAKEFTRVKEEPAMRGRILDAQGRVLAESLPAWSVYGDPSGVKNPAGVAKQLAPLLEVPESELRLKLRQGGHFAWLKRKVDMDRAQRISALKIQGIGLSLEENRNYPNGALARGVLGAVGVDGGGLSGLEHVFDKELEGANRRLRLTMDAAGHPLDRRDQGNYRPPHDVQLTLDASIQYFAEEALSRGVAKARAKGGMAIVQNPRTGEILAMASSPSDPFHNGPVQDTFEPGSTVKFVTAVAAVEENAVSLSEKIDCEGGHWAAFPGVVIHDHEPYKMMTLAQIIQNSSNIGTAKIAERLGASVFHRYTSLFGLGLPTGLGLPGEPSGYVAKPQDMRPVTLATSAYGYGLAVTGIQLATAYSAIANGGTLFQPRIARAVWAPGGKLLSSSTPQRIRQVASPRTIEAVRQMLVGVVESGTGENAKIPGYGVAGKTGTAHKRDPETGKYATGGYIASFSGFVPSADPKFTILVVIDSPKGAYYGAEVAAPVFSDIAKQVLAYKGTPKDSPAPLGTAR